MLSCIYWGALFGGAITSILFNIPGEPWSVATTFDGYPMARSLVERIGRVNAKAFDRSLATVGVYGKVGEVKGTYDLLAALDALAARQVPLNFLAVACGTPGRLTEFYESVTGMAHRKQPLTPIRQRFGRCVRAFSLQAPSSDGSPAFWSISCLGCSSAHSIGFLM